MPDGDLVIIDRNDVIRTALFTYFSVHGRKNPNALLAQAFVLMHAAILPKPPLPFQNLLSFELTQGRLATPDFLECLNTSLDFVALHEFGHVYIEIPNASHDFFHTRLVPTAPADNVAPHQGLKANADDTLLTMLRDEWNTGVRMAQVIMINDVEHNS